MIDVLETDASFTFDVSRQIASASATMTFRVLDDGGPAAFDLRQEIGTATLDGRILPVDWRAPQDLGGGPGAEMRVIDQALAPGTVHELALRYELATPRANDAQP